MRPRLNDERDSRMMNFDPARFVRPEVSAMSPYTPIVPFEVLSQRLGLPPQEITKLDANENLYGPSPAALAALTAAANIHIYPDPEARALREALSDFTGLPAGRLLAGMGADELIDLVLRAVLRPGDVVVDCPPSFGMYPFSTAVNGGSYLPIPRRADFSLDLESIRAGVGEHERARVLFACSPNNPDGSMLSNDTLRQLLALPLLIVLDEAYIDFAAVTGHHSRLDWALRYPNLVVLRTFSKLAGLAGLRIGYGAFPEWLLPHLWKIKQPYNVNAAANAAVLASLRDRKWLDDKVSRIVAERERMVAVLKVFDFLKPYPSQANFVLFRVLGRSAHALKLRLEREGILVRHFAKPGIENCIRISAGRPQDTDRLVAALHRIGTEGMA
jgi:histidinol-phosphate aminotransferase